MKAVVMGTKSVNEYFSYTLDNIRSIDFINGALYITRENEEGKIVVISYNEAATGYKYNITFA